MAEAIRYRVLPVDPAAHLFRVELSVDTPAAQQRFTLPAWIPGSYMIRDFARNIVTIEARDENGPLPLQKLDKQTWQAEGAQGALTLNYNVYAWDLSVRSAHLDATHGYFNGTSLFLAVNGQEEQPCSVELLPPEGEPYRDWRVATTLPRAGAEAYGFGSYRAADYDELIDHPVEMGTFTLLEFEAAGIPHAMAITGRHYTDTERLARDLKTICEHHLAFWGGEPPIDRYLFQTMVVGDGYGGLEHRNSTSLMCKRDDLPRIGDEGVSDGYRNFLGLCSHEYFHTWNVKRIKPAAFTPYDLSRESHTTLLWAFEGITSYYDELALVRSGLITPESYLELLGQTLTRVQRGSGRFKQSVAESSFDAWTKFYKQDENAPNAIVSYYAKGAFIALTLDLTIRRETGGERSLDDLMRALWQRHGVTGEGVTEEGIEALFEEISGVELKPLFDRYLRDTEELPLQELLGEFGVTLAYRPAESLNDMGGKAGKDESALTKRVELSVRSQPDPLGAKLAVVFEGGSAHRGGLSAGDIIIAIDGLQCRHDNLDTRLSYFKPGDSVTVHAFRRDELMQFQVPLQAASATTCYLTLDQEAGDETSQRRSVWLNI